MVKISEKVAEKVQATIPIDLQIQGAHAYDKTRRWVTGTNGKKLFVERPIPPAEEVELADIDWLGMIVHQVEALQIDERRPIVGSAGVC